MTFLISWVLGTLPVQAESRPAETGATLTPQVVVDLVSDHPLESRYESWTRLRAWSRVPTDSGTWRFEARGLQTLQSGGPSLTSEALESTWELELGDTSWEGPVGPFWFAIGNRVERWGQMDLLSVVDVLNGRDLRAGPLVPAELARVPSPMASLELPLWNSANTNGAIEVSLLPYGSNDRAPLIGTDWALMKPGMLEQLVTDMGSWEGDALSESFLQETVLGIGGLLDGLNPQTRAELGGLLAAQSKSTTPGNNADIAGQLKSQLGRHDVSLFAAWMRSRQPNPELDPLLVSLFKEERLPTLAEQDDLLDAVSSGLSLEQPRTWMLGVDFSSWAGPVGVRAEGSWVQNQTVPTPWLGIVHSPSLSGALGLDWVQGSNFALVLEGSWKHLLDAPASLWLQAEDQVHLAMAAQITLMAERLQIQPAVLWDASFDEWMYRPGLSWRPLDSIRADLTLVLLTADEPAPREFRDAMTTSLGPLGYTSDNDSLAFSITWIQ